MKIKKDFEKKVEAVIYFRKKYERQAKHTEKYKGTEGELSEYIRGYLNAASGKYQEISFSRIEK